MKSAYFRELEKLSFIEMKERLNANKEDVNYIIKYLQYNNRKIVKISTINNELKYSFDFVGIILYKNFIIKCYPKYYNKDYSDSDKDILLKKIVKVLKKFNTEINDVVRFSNNDDCDEINFLSIISFIMDDFFNNGLYYNEKEIFEYNGEGEIQWQKTIDELGEYIVKEKPIYFDYITSKKITNDENFITRIHKYAINECNILLEENGLLEIMSYPSIRYDVDNELIYDYEYINNTLLNELSKEYISQKQELLKALYLFFKKKQEYSLNSFIGFYGTMDFNLIWEKICATILKNQLNNRIDTIEGIDLLKEYSGSYLLKDIIPYPYWNIFDCNKSIKANGTIELDIISIFEDSNQRYFIIWDAKYYNLILKNDKIKNNPGIQDIIKQYIYKLVYKNFIEEQKFTNSYNILLFPSEENKIEILGTVDFEILRDALRLDDILVVKMPSEKVYDLYLEDKYIDMKCIIKLLNNIEKHRRIYNGI